MLKVLKSLIVWSWRVPFIRRWLTATEFDQGGAIGHIRNRDGSLYMGRWSVIRERSWCPIAARVHFIASPDDGRALHDHPWNFTTIILEGGYTEEDIYGNTHGRSTGDMIRHSAQDFHTITELNDPSNGSWSLFIYGRKRHSWGFLFNDRKVNHWDYAKMRDRNET
jgi:hypothetical protein